jgi:serine/threonine protein kinase
MGSGISKQSIELKKQQFLYTICLGHGGFSQVYSAMHTSTGKWYAIKEISLRQTILQKNGLEIIQNELEVMKRLEKNSHSSCPHLYYAFRDTSTCYLVFDLLTGGDLRYHLRKHHHFSESGIAFLIASLAQALHHLHSHGILHRDVKPENILLDSLGTPYLVDYGVSHLSFDPSFSSSSSFSSAHHRLLCYESSGTRQYLAPEVLTRSHEHGIESDFWSLGVVMFELLHHRRPFDKYCPVEFIEFAEIARLRGDRHSDHRQIHVITTLETNPFSAPSSTTNPLLVSPTPRQGQGHAQGHGEGEDEGDDKNESESVRYQRQRELFISDCLRQYCRESEQNPVEDSNQLTDPMPPAPPASRTIVKVPCPSLSSSASGSSSSLRRCNCGDQLYDEIFCQSPHHHRSSLKKSSLPSHLTVPIPHISKIYGELSTPCIDVLTGLLDVRLWSRLGAGVNYPLLSSHRWFQNQSVDWVFRSPFSSSSFSSLPSSSSLSSPQQRDPDRYFIPCQEEINSDLYQRFIQEACEGSVSPLGRHGKDAETEEQEKRQRPWTNEQQKYLDDTLGNFYYHFEKEKKAQQTAGASGTGGGRAGDSYDKRSVETRSLLALHR